MRDHLLDRITETEYDESGRACRTKTHDTAGHIYTGEVDYEPATGLLSVFRAYIGTGYTRYGSTFASFVYNSDGLRIRKTVGSTVINYTLHGTNTVHMTHGTTNLHFFYDSEDRPAIVVYGGNRYGNVKNLQGDVLGLINDSGTEVVRYVYDAWGKLLATTGIMATTLGRIQPFRYRGYVYDEETGLYDLRSRYYNPEWGRFVNADSLVKGNLYCYCGNEPVYYNDENGYWYSSLRDTAFGGYDFLSDRLLWGGGGGGSSADYSGVQDILVRLILHGRMHKYMKRFG